ncbi:50S ribosomal protein L11 methyltransferase [Actinomarinicola tropica]|uniref:Ribosomal protein L11 methyltransferase n=1 Tax=Actinomarinicola tropica TaxID=2789776 RepID=A0A5Q2RHQ8_9ACTN|nr:50S ribosomal protein L11 methyltransferase [Actinomarinicola tropica]QGG96319.1 methyltransferase domain-containing protein [Actinomarinicola tropica]
MEGIDGGHRAEAVEVVVDRSGAELAAGLLWSLGISALVEEDAADGSVLLRCDVPPGGVEAARATLGTVATSVELVRVDDGLDAWRAHAEAVRAGRRLVVRPPWVPLGELRPDEVVVELDPGRSWGHGAHPTTRLCLGEVERLCDRGGIDRVLDVGCGSGALSIAAALLGAGHVVACDIDPEAVRATGANAERNAVGERIAARLVDDHERHDPLAPVDGTFDLVVANIGAAALRALAPHLLARLSSDGVLIVSGLLDPPPPDLPAAFAPLQVAADLRLDGWTALTLQRRSATDEPGVTAPSSPAHGARRTS